MSGETIAELFSDFQPIKTDRLNSLKEAAPVTIWLPAEAKARYDRLQELSGRRFSKKAREVLLATIAHAEKILSAT
jgi:hypothetical protein